MASRAGACDVTFQLRVGIRPSRTGPTADGHPFAPIDPIAAVLESSHAGAGWLQPCALGTLSRGGDAPISL